MLASSPDGAMLLEKMMALEERISSRWGMSLTAYPTALVQRLLEELPGPGQIREGKLDEHIRQSLSIGETHILRHRHHFEVLARLAPGLLTNRRPLRAWSSACSTGEEAWTIAATLHEVLPGRFEVLGSDLNPDSVRTAMEARYRSWSMRGVQATDVVSWLEQQGESWVVRPHLRESVKFRVANLMERPYPSDLDVIFCRNVLIYLRPDAIRSIFLAMREALVPGGLLFLSATDPQPDPASGFEMVDDGATRYYRRPLAGVVAEPSKPSPKVVSRAVEALPPSVHAERWAQLRADHGRGRTAEPTRNVAGASRVEPRMESSRPSVELASRPVVLPATEPLRSVEASRSVELARSLEPASKPMMVTGAAPGQGTIAEMLADLRAQASVDPNAAVAQVADLVDENPDDPALRCFAAARCAQVGHFDLALIHARQALFLKPSDALPNLLVGVLMGRNGTQVPYAQQRLRRARQLLEEMPPDRVVPLSDSATASELLRLLRAPHDSEHYQRI